MCVESIYQYRSKGSALNYPGRPAGSTRTETRAVHTEVSGRSSPLSLDRHIMSSVPNGITSPSAFSTRAVWKVAKPTGSPKQVRSRKGAKARSWTEKEVSLLVCCGWDYV